MHFFLYAAAGAITVAPAAASARVITQTSTAPGSSPDTRAAAACRKGSRGERHIGAAAAVVKAERVSKGDSVRTRLSIDVPPTRSAAAPKQELRLTFDELRLIYKSLQAVKTLGALPPEDELLENTIQLVDQALYAAIRWRGPIAAVQRLVVCRAEAVEPIHPSQTYAVIVFWAMLPVSRTKDGASMEPVVATGGNRSQMVRLGDSRRQANTVAADCDQLRSAFHGK
jgi:hypothetical protein